MSPITHGVVKLFQHIQIRGLNHEFDATYTDSYRPFTLEICCCSLPPPRARIHVNVDLIDGHHHDLGLGHAGPPDAGYLLGFDLLVSSPHDRSHNLRDLLRRRGLREIVRAMPKVRQPVASIDPAPTPVDPESHPPERDLMREIGLFEFVERRVRVHSPE